MGLLSSDWRDGGLLTDPKGAKVGRRRGRGVGETGWGFGMDVGKGEGKPEKETG